MNSRELARLQTRSRWLAHAVTGLAGLVALSVLLSLAGELFGKPAPGEPPTFVERVPQLVAFWAPTAFYLWALLAVRRALGDVAKGRLLQPALARSLRDVGLALFGGGITSAVVQPNLMRFTGGLYASYAHFDVAYLAVGAVGLALVLLSRVLHRAAEVQAELDDII